MTRRIAHLALAAALSLAAAPALAQEDGTSDGLKGLERFFALIDENGNGRIEPAEIEAARAGLFSRLDADGDGSVTAEEHQQAVDRLAERAERFAARGQQRFGRLDAVGDGRISRAEFVERQRPGFALADRNEDGAIDMEEAERVARSLRQFRQAAAGRSADPQALDNHGA